LWLLFEELPGEKFEDWTLKKGYDPSGDLTLVEGLMRHVNHGSIIWGWTCSADGCHLSSDMARGFGMGSATGIERWLMRRFIPDPK
jgi:hypothetical protein